MSKPIQITLVNTSHPGNIGAVARAMKTMGLNNLCLVAPKCFPNAQATAMASGADDVLHNAKVVSTLDEAIGDLQFVVGASARSRTLPWPIFSLREGAPIIAQKSFDSKVGIVFGREDSGLTNDELAKCHYHLNIPAHSEYTSLNLAQAVQVVCYELRMNLLEIDSLVGDSTPKATMAELESFFEHLKEVSQGVGFLRGDNSIRLYNRLRRVFLKSELDINEINILRGLIRGIRRKLQPLLD